LSGRQPDSTSSARTGDAIAKWRETTGRLRNVAVFDNFRRARRGKDRASFCGRLSRPAFDYAVKKDAKYCVS
jgi:hypothetical protein